MQAVRAVPAETAGVVLLPRRRADASAVALDDNVAVYDDVGQLLILLNVSAAAVWECCDGATTTEDIADRLAAGHDAEAADIAEDVRRTVAKLAELGLVVEADGDTDGDTAGPPVT